MVALSGHLCPSCGLVAQRQLLWPGLPLFHPHRADALSPACSVLRPSPSPEPLQQRSHTPAHALHSWLHLSSTTQHTTVPRRALPAQHPGLPGPLLGWSFPVLLSPPPHWPIAPAVEVLCQHALLCDPFPAHPRRTCVSSAPTRGFSAGGGSRAERGGLSFLVPPGARCRARPHDTLSCNSHYHPVRQCPHSCFSSEGTKTQGG